jgi:hypothetical protein
MYWSIPKEHLWWRRICGPVLGVDNWDDYVIWHRQTALCRNCVLKKNKVMDRLQQRKMKVE